MLTSVTVKIIGAVAIGSVLGTCFMYVRSNRLRCKTLIRRVPDNNDMCELKSTFIFLIHGGAGVVSKTIDSQPYYDSLKGVLSATYHFIEECIKSRKNISAVDIVECAVKLLEDNPLFNAGYGSVYTANERHELEASIMNGETRSSGAVSLINTVKNPISLARLVMEETNHAYMVGESAEELAVNLPRVKESYYSTVDRLNQLHAAKKKAIVINDCDDPDSKGTVGCVCMFNGHVAAATSTGGMTNKLPGRVGDSPIIGAGTYAYDKTAAISATGKGETFIKHVVAYDISARMDYGGQSLQEAVIDTVNSLPSQTGGVIAVNNRGEYSMEFNSNGMFRGVCFDSGHCEIGIWDELIRFNIME